MAVKQRKKVEPTDLELLPFMGLFAVLIPILLSMASFQKLGIVDINMPIRSDVPPDDAPPPPPDDNAINLSILLGKDEKGYQYISIGARGGFLPSIYYKEMHTYNCKADGDTITYDPAELAMTSQTPKCRDGSETNKYEISDIHLWFLERTSEDDPGKLTNAVYSFSDSVYVDGANNFVTSKSAVRPGAVLMTLKEASNRKITPDMASKAVVKPLSAYDHLAKELIGIHSRFIDAPDADKIIIVADDETAFDKIIKLMDRSREAGFWQIQLAKLGG